MFFRETKSIFCLQSPNRADLFATTARGEIKDEIRIGNGSKSFQASRLAIGQMAPQKSIFVAFIVCRIQNTNIETVQT